MSRHAILVTGGAGYIGSNLVARFVAQGRSVVVIDNLSNGHDWAIHPKAHYFNIDYQDSEAVTKVIQEFGIKHVVHCAADIQVGESVLKPLQYYQNNSANLIGFLKVLEHCKISTLILSSTAAVYGTSQETFFDEQSEINPANPYGWSKVFAERLVEDWSKNLKHDFRKGVMRYFNVAGAGAGGMLGQETKVATHLIKILCKVVTGQISKIQIFGTDYATPDGTCVRDYIHIEDLASAHLLLQERLEAQPGHVLFNAGYGIGFSVLEVLRAMENVSGQKIPHDLASRRSGDAGTLVANSQRLKVDLGWAPVHADLREICRSALSFERLLLKGRAGFQKTKKVA